MGIEMAAERIAKPTIDELTEDLLAQQSKIENHSSNGEAVPEELFTEFYRTYEKYLEIRLQLKRGSDRNLEDPIASKLAATFARASRVVRGDHGNSHHEHWH